MSEQTAADLIQDANMHKCARCGWDTENHTPPKATEAESKEYVRRLLAGEIYSKAYTLFGGQLSVAYTALSSDTSNRMQNILDQIEGKDQLAINQKAMQVKLVFYLSQLQTNKYNLPEAMTLEDADIVYGVQFGTLGEDVIAILIRTMMEFTNLLNLLADSGFDEDFWKGAGLG